MLSMRQCTATHTTMVMSLPTFPEETVASFSLDGEGIQTAIKSSMCFNALTSILWGSSAPPVQFIFKTLQTCQGPISAYLLIVFQIFGLDVVGTKTAKYTLSSCRSSQNLRRLLHSKQQQHQQQQGLYPQASPLPRAFLGQHPHLSLQRVLRRPCSSTQ